MIQRVIEAAQIPTVGITLNRPYTERVKPPRSVFLRWPFGHPMGEPGHIHQQAAVLRLALDALYSIQVPGTILDPGWVWQRRHYEPAPWLSKLKSCKGA